MLMLSQDQLILSTEAGVKYLNFEVIIHLMEDYTFLLQFLQLCILQGNGMDELPERLIGAVRVSHLSLASATPPLPEVDY